jgi:hypothetical protein
VFAARYDLYLYKQFMSGFILKSKNSVTEFWNLLLSSELGLNKINDSNKSTNKMQDFYKFIA